MCLKRWIGMAEIVIATNNVGKIQEMRELLEPYQLQAQGYQAYHETVTFPEEHGNYAENALQKVRFIQNLLQTDLPVLGDDSGLYLAAYPRCFQQHTHRDLKKGLPLSHTAYLLELLRQRPKQSREIQLVTHLTLGLGTDFYTATSILKGRVATTELGTMGFDLDRIVIPEGMQQTLAQMVPEQRQKVQQRQAAIEKLLMKIEGGRYGDSRTATDTTAK